ncbi:MAG: tetratricopeptide repeat protein [bacterium]|jgi:tetratricopeptide (TPR) repeat protein|nr:tetratricopeptide repeat protein [bacterium]
MTSHDLYDHEINRFKELYETDQNYAIKRYGLTLLYSLQPEETLKMRDEIKGMAGVVSQSQDGLDLYNLGTLEAEKGKYQEAMALFKKAESMGCGQPELFFNIAVILEEQNQIPEAIGYYQKYIEKSELWDTLPKSLQLDLDETRDHIKELKEDRAD